VCVFVCVYMCVCVSECVCVCVWVSEWIRGCHPLLQSKLNYEVASVVLHCLWLQSPSSPMSLQEAVRYAVLCPNKYTVAVTRNLLFSSSIQERDEFVKHLFFGSGDKWHRQRWFKSVSLQSMLKMLIYWTKARKP